MGVVFPGELGLLVGVELASGLLQWASRITLSSPSPAKTSIETRSLVGVRARYGQPFEDSALGGGVDILAASIDGIAPVVGGIRVDLKRSDNGMPVSLEVDEVISATGFTCPLVDLPALGVATFGQSRLPGTPANWLDIELVAPRQRKVRLRRDVLVEGLPLLGVFV